MKDSGIEWIGEIPEGWEIATLRHCIASIESGTSVNAGYYPAEENEYGVLKTSCVYNDNFNYNENKSVNYDEYERVKCPVKKHCLIISRMNTPDLVGSCGYTESSYQNIFLPDRLWQVSFLKKFYYKFIYYFFASHATKIYISSHATGTSGSMKNISQKQLVNTPFVFPPFSEQERIADYLDAKCAHIDQCLELTRQSMEKLRAYKLSCITEAVTKGLDPDVPLKDSGVPWIGQIPAGWECTRLMTLCSEISTGPFGSQLHAEDYVENQTPLINPSNINNFRIEANYKCTLDSNTVSRLKRHILYTGEIIFARRGEMGRCALVEKQHEGFICGTGCLKASIKKDINQYYLIYYLQAKFVPYFLEYSSVGTTMNNLNSKTIASIPVTLPPLPEQERIAAYLDKKCARIDALLEEKQALLDKLAEYKKA